MGYQGAGMNGADGLGLRLRLPKKIKSGIKRLGKGLKRLSKSPTVRGAVIGAAAGAIYGQVQKRRKKSKAAATRQAEIDRANAELDRLGPPKVVDIVGGATQRPTPATYIPPVQWPGTTPVSGPVLDKTEIANKIMAGIPLTAEEMALVRSGALGQGMLAAAEAAYGTDVYQPGAGQPLPGMTITAEKDNTLLYAGLGLVGLLLLTSKRGN